MLHEQCDGISEPDSSVRFFCRREFVSEVSVPVSYTYTGGGFPQTFFWYGYYQSER